MCYTFTSCGNAKEYKDLVGEASSCSPVSLIGKRKMEQASYFFFSLVKILQEYGD